MTTTLKIKITPIGQRTWTSLDAIRKVYTEEEMVTMIHRYQDAQDHAIDYRKKAQVKTKTMKARLAQLEAMAAAGELGGDDDEQEEE
jgi:hypothetical protein